MMPPPRAQADWTLQRYLQDIGYQWTILLATGAFEAGGGLMPGHYLVFDAKDVLRYNGPQESKAEQIMRAALLEAEQEARKAKRGGPRACGARGQSRPRWRKTKIRAAPAAKPAMWAR